MKQKFILFVLTGVLLMSSPMLHAYPYGGCWGGGGWYRGGGCYRGGWGGWYGTGIPNGLGWTMFGLGAAAVAAPIAYAAVAPAPVYYNAPYYPPVGYYNPPEEPVAVKRTSHAVVHQAAKSPANPTLTQVQSRLAALGYYKGTIDGNFGPQTEMAVTKFQGENGLPMTGHIDLKTLASLGVTL